MAESLMKRKQTRWLLLLLLVSGLTAFLAPNFLRARAQGSLPSCPSGCKNIAAALAMYAEDNEGCYPHSLSRLTDGNYLKLIPTCPAAGRDTYSASYQTARAPERFSFVCMGNNHAKAYRGFSTSSNNYPQYSSEHGLLDHP